MKQTTLKIVVLFALLIIVSCKNKNALLLPIKEVFVDAIAPDTIKGEIIGEFPGTEQLYSYDSLLFVETKDPSGQLRVLSTKDHKQLINLCIKGRAKNEFIDARSFCNQFYINEGHVILVLSDNNFEMKMVDINESLIQNHTVVTKVVQPIVNARRGYSLYNPNKNEWFTHYNLSFEDPEDEVYYPPRFTVSDSDYSKEYDIPVFGRLMDLPQHSSYPFFIYQGNMRMKPDNSKVVFAHFYMPYFFIFDLHNNDGLAVHAFGKTNFEDGYSPDDPTNIDLSINDVCVTDNYILALCPNGKQNGYVSNNLRPLIRCFNWEGDCLFSFTLDHIVCDIAYDETTKQLFALDNSREIIYRYEVSKFFE